MTTNESSTSSSSTRRRKPTKPQRLSTLITAGNNAGGYVPPLTSLSSLALSSPLLSSLSSTPTLPEESLGSHSRTTRGPCVSVVPGDFLDLWKTGPDFWKEHLANCLAYYQNFVRTSDSDTIRQALAKLKRRLKYSRAELDNVIPEEWDRLIERIQRSREVRGSRTETKTSPTSAVPFVRWKEWKQQWIPLFASAKETETKVKPPAPAETETRWKAQTTNSATGPLWKSLEDRALTEYLKQDDYGKRVKILQRELAKRREIEGTGVGAPRGVMEGPDCIPLPWTSIITEEQWFAHLQDCKQKNEAFAAKYSEDRREFKDRVRSIEAQLTHLADERKRLMNTWDQLLKERRLVLSSASSSSSSSSSTTTTPYPYPTMPMVTFTDWELRYDPTVLEPERKKWTPDQLEYYGSVVPRLWDQQRTNTRTPTLTQQWTDLETRLQQLWHEREEADTRLTSLSHSWKRFWEIDSRDERDIVKHLEQYWDLRLALVQSIAENEIPRLQEDLAQLDKEEASEVSVSSTKSSNKTKSYTDDERRRIIERTKELIAIDKAVTRQFLDDLKLSVAANERDIVFAYLLLARALPGHRQEFLDKLNLYPDLLKSFLAFVEDPFNADSTLTAMYIAKALPNPETIRKDMGRYRFWTSDRNLEQLLRKIEQDASSSSSSSSSSSRSAAMSSSISPTQGKEGKEEVKGSSPGAVKEDDDDDDDATATYEDIDEEDLVDMDASVEDEVAARFDPSVAEDDEKLVRVPTEEMVPTDYEGVYWREYKDLFAKSTRLRLEREFNNERKDYLPEIKDEHITTYGHLTKLIASLEEELVKLLDPNKGVVTTSLSSSSTPTGGRETPSASSLVYVTLETPTALSKEETPVTTTILQPRKRIRPNPLASLLSSTTIPTPTNTTTTPSLSLPSSSSSLSSSLSPTLSSFSTAPPVGGTNEAPVTILTARKRPRPVVSK